MKQFLYIFLLAGVTAGCSDNQATVEEESKTTVNRKKPADDQQSNTIEPGMDEVNVDTLGLAEFLAWKAAKADLTDENDIKVDTTGFTEFKRSKAKTTPRPCDCDSIAERKRNDSIAESKRNNNSRNSRSSTTERSSQQSESQEEETKDTTDQQQ